MLGGSDVVIASRCFIGTSRVRGRLRRQQLVTFHCALTDAIADPNAGADAGWVVDVRPDSCRRGLFGDRAFTPDQLNVAVGTTVTWTNTDAISHTSTSNATGWDSGILAPGGQFSFTFQSAGTFPYHCAIHPGMVGTVVVN